MSKLWIVERTYTAVALADSEEEAIDVSEDSLRWDEPEIYGRVWSGKGHLPDEWTPQCLVYHAGENDITVAQAIANTEVVTQPVAEAPEQNQPHL